MTFTTSLKPAVDKSRIIFLCLPTPQSENGAADLSHVLNVSRQISQFVDGEKLIVSKSTVPVGTVDKIRQILRKEAKNKVDVASNPEFLKEGTALQDSLKPDRIIIGSRNKKTIALLQELYEPFVRTGNPIIVMDERSAEMTKYAANAFLATKISFMNELANLCEEVGADIDWVRKGIASDPRIGKQFLFPGLGYGGSCLPKDVKALQRTAADAGRPLRLLAAVEAVNEAQKHVLGEKIRKRLGDLKGKCIGVWGLAFKANTDDMREAPSLTLIDDLVRAGAKVQAYDPVAGKGFRKQDVTVVASALAALEGADALAIVTEWREFRSPDFAAIKARLKTPAIFDGRNLYDPAQLRELGIEYYPIGRKL